MYTLREIKHEDGVISNMEIGCSYIEIRKKIDENGNINKPFLEVYNKVFGKDYNNEDNLDINTFIEYTSMSDGKIWHKSIKDSDDSYILSENGNIFEEINF